VCLVGKDDLHFAAIAGDDRFAFAQLAAADQRQLLGAEATGRLRCYISDEP